MTQDLAKDTAMLKNKLEMYYSGQLEPSWTAYQYFVPGEPEAFYLEELTGWDEDETIAVRSEQKLIGSGEYLISFSRGARNIQVTISTKFIDQGSLRTFQGLLRTQMLSLSKVTLERVFQEDEGPETVEQIDGFITSLSKWDQREKEASIRFTVWCPEPDYL